MNEGGCWDVVLADHAGHFNLGLVVCEAGAETPAWTATMLAGKMPRQTKAEAFIRAEFKKRGLEVSSATPGRRVKEGPLVRWFWQVETL